MTVETAAKSMVEIAAGIDASGAAFPPEFRDRLWTLMRWRRDVRRFRSDPIAPDLKARLLDSVALAPSVGLSEPWRLVAFESAAARAGAQASFEAMNAAALAAERGEAAERYARLKLSGMREAPWQLAVFVDEATEQGRGLGARSMPETRAYSAVCAIMQLWLAARAEGIGLGWVSILDPSEIARLAQAPTSWRLVGYLCLGWPDEAHLTPELERAGWEARTGRPTLREV